MNPALNAFEYAGLPSRVVFAGGAVDRSGEYVDSAGGARVMLVCGGKTGRSRLVARVRSALVDRGLYFNPRPTPSADAVIGLLEQAW